MKLYTWTGTCGNPAESWFQRTQESFVLLCWSFSTWPRSPFTIWPCLLKSSWTNVTFQSVILRVLMTSLPLLFSVALSSPWVPISVSPSRHPADVDCMTSMLTATWWVLAEPGLDPDGTGVCEKNKIHHSLALRPWASYLSSLDCNFVAEFGETEVLMRITWEYRLKHLEPSGCSYLVSWFLLHAHVLMQLY